MPPRITVVRGDITEQDTDAIVNAANERLAGGGGVDGAIHRAAGPQLLDACMELPVIGPGMQRCETGDAQVTPGFRLCKYVIHAVGPKYESHPDPQGALRKVFSKSLQRAVAVGARSISFPAISCGAYGFPIIDAAYIATDAVLEQEWKLDEIRFVLHDRQAYDVFRQALGVEP